VRDLAELSLTPLSGRLVEGTVEVDLRDGWLQPGHLVGVAALAQSCASRGRPFRLAVGPTRTSYASRMHLGAVLSQLGAGHALPPVPERARERDLLEVTPLVSPDGTRRLAALVRDKVLAQDPEAAGALYACLTELGLNVQEHAGTTGFAAAQTLLRREEVLFAVADCGRGLAGTLALRGATNDREAVELALRGVSRLDAPDRGLGLRTMVALVGRLGGSLSLISGGAVALAGRAGVRYRESRTPFAGTLVQGRVRLGIHTALPRQEKGGHWSHV